MFSIPDRKKIAAEYERIKADLEQGFAIDVYSIWPYNWRSHLTPIEINLWEYLRLKRHVVYPQYPIGPYFVDFCDPVNKVVYEADGKDWHLDKEKDALRDSNLKKMGYEVIRYTGQKTYEILDELEDDNEALSYEYDGEKMYT